jgi:GTP cyclohydrolase I
LELQVNEPTVLDQLRQLAPGDPPARDLAAAIDGARVLLVGLGVDLTSAHLINTPDRMVRSLAEMLTPAPFDPTLFAVNGSGTDLVMVSGIEFGALCAHHVLPFAGTADIAYVPDAQVLGLSKLPRMTAATSARLQVQEELTAGIADWVMAAVNPLGVGVRVRARHLCMFCRGPRSGAVTTTVATRGVLKTDAARRAEWVAMVGAEAA